ncbi:imidazole glycerol phosphate synthase subunit HisH [Corynebacterium sp. Marseille-P4321]|uniref:imidazole glycerol phosphate synthase subunit HisH n=1 Tax=Corynebacterium sp. Marseille-P4321 TaxID=2736603 RepID=UPI00158BC939|nr:imidazole glycerol phosphate synthase subunit HisH [Corynebacterium sp. Marseille-P4321]
MTHIPAGVTVAVLDVSANTAEVVEAIKKAGAIAFATTDPREAAAADGMVLPGAESFALQMEALGEVQGARVVGQRLAGARPVLAIGTGMQVLFEQLLDDASGVAGLGEWPGGVDKLDAPCETATVEPARGTELLRGVDGPLSFGNAYGVRGFALEEDEFIAYPRLSWAQCGDNRFIAAVENGALWATQFHPERSGEAGMDVLRNWLAQLG